VAVQELAAQAAVKPLNESIVGRLARPREVERDAVLIGLAVERLRDEPRPLVYSDVLSPDGVAMLSKGKTAKEFVSDAFGHSKFIGYTADALPFIV
jgi:hypothetical protein